MRTKALSHGPLGVILDTNYILGQVNSHGNGKLELLSLRKQMQKWQRKKPNGRAMSVLPQERRN
jgi:hypothetical protein